MNKKVHIMFLKPQILEKAFQQGGTFLFQDIRSNGRTVVKVQSIQIDKGTAASAFGVRGSINQTLEPGI